MSAQDYFRQFLNFGQNKATVSACAGGVIRRLVAGLRSKNHTANAGKKYQPVTLQSERFKVILAGMACCLTASQPARRTRLRPHFSHPFHLPEYPMQFLPTLLAVNPSFIALGSVALALTMLSATLCTLAYKATQPAHGE